MKLLLVCLAIVATTLAAPRPPAVKKQVKGYEVKKEYVHKDKDPHHGYAPYHDDGYDKDYKRVEVKKYGYEQKKDGYGYDHKDSYGYGHNDGYGYDRKDSYGYDRKDSYGHPYDKDDKGYYAGYERVEYKDSDKGYKPYGPHGYDNDRKYVVKERGYYGGYDNDRDYYGPRHHSGPYDSHRGYDSYGKDRYEGGYAQKSYGYRDSGYGYQDSYPGYKSPYGY